MYLYRLDSHTENGIVLGTLRRQAEFHAECRDNTNGKGRAFHEAEVRQIELAIKTLEGSLVLGHKDIS